MIEPTFNDQDRKQMKERGITLEKVLSQLKSFKKGLSHIKLQRPCMVEDGITVLSKEDLPRLEASFSKAALLGRAMKFVPASGAASRMFKSLLSMNEQYEQIDTNAMSAEVDKDDLDHALFSQFIKGLTKFAFYDDLKSAMSRDSLDIENLISNGKYKQILEYVLTAKGLNLANIPKGLIKFHSYPGSSRTAFEEHLVEAIKYAMDMNKVVRLHFTVSPEHEELVKKHLKAVQGQYEKSGIRFELSFSTQKSSTDTIAVDMENKPFRDGAGRLVFRPGGHGALLKNLSDLKGDLVFIKNIDNVAPDRLKQETFVYKKALGGYLLELQKEIFENLRRLTPGDVDKQSIKEMFEFIKHKLSVIPPEGMEQRSRKEKIIFLTSMLHRPLRVCGMVKNVAEPGGGPFWVEHEDKSISLQIVESSQVDMESGSQRDIWSSSTHFNPVDLVCGVRDYRGTPFDLMRFVNPDTGFISTKSQQGKELKVLELPGLWNGSMAHWNTIFVQVPAITFNPTKIVLDLLRKEHQPA
jgi:hypothetical protein